MIISTPRSVMGRCVPALAAALTLLVMSLVAPPAKATFKECLLDEEAVTHCKALLESITGSNEGAEDAYCKDNVAYCNMEAELRTDG